MVALTQALGIAYAAGISPYATLTLLGLMDYADWIGPLPGALGAATAPVFLVLWGTLATVEFVATLVPGVALLWDTVHTAIRPPAAVALAVATAWHADPAIIAVAGVLGGGLATATHATKLGVRAAVDSSPEPVTNGAMNVAEWGLVASVVYFVWHHPIIALGIALAVLVTTAVLLRTAWRWIRRRLGREEA